MRLTLAVAVACLTLGGLAAAGDATAAIRKLTDIPAEGLAPALNALAKDRNFQIVYVTEEIANVRTEGAVGEFTTEEALQKLLTGTGLTYRYLDDKTVTVGSAKMSRERSQSAAKITSSGSPDDANANQEGKKSSSQDFRVAQVDQRKSSSPSSVGGQGSTSQENYQNPPSGLDEIIVTAEKRKERLQDVPVPISVIDTQALADTQQVLLKDWYASVPGLSVIPSGYFTQNVALRGVYTGGGGPTVGILIDDAPFSGTTEFDGGDTVPDIDPGDLDHIEVLRGPQGTLYGASSMGGLIKFVTVDPSTSALSGRAEAGLDGVYNGSGPGFNVRASANIPLNDTLAVRVSGYDRRDAGYIDNPILDRNGLNEANTYGGRLSALWKPWDGWSLKLSGLYQHTQTDGANDVDAVPGFSGLVQDHVPSYSGVSFSTLNFYDAALNGKVGSAQLTAITSYSHYHFDIESDDSRTFTFFGIPQINLFNSVNVTRINEEVRLTGSAWQHLDWLAGLFYGHNYGPYMAFIPTVGAANRFNGVEYNYYDDQSYREEAGFVNLTYHFTDRFDIQAGARDGRIVTDIAPAYATGPGAGILYGSNPYMGARSGADSKPVTFLFTPSFKFSPDDMMYVRVASGFRPGQANFVLFGIPPQSAPDKTYNYEVGFKGDFLDHRLSVDTSLFYIDWKNIQVTLSVPPIPFNANVGAAKSEGVEFAVTGRPTESFTISAWIDYDNAVLTKNLPPSAANGGTFGYTGDRLPFNARISAKLSAEKKFSLGSRVAGFVGATASFVGNRLGDLRGVAGNGVPLPREYYGSYTKTDLHAGGKFESWTVSIYANNVADIRAPLAAGPDFYYPGGALYITPRTVGLSVAKTF